MFSRGLPVLSALGGVALAVAAAVLLFGWLGLAVAGAGVLAAACGALSWWWLGGVTGDTLGATIQLTELGVLVAILGLR